MTTRERRGPLTVSMLFCLGEWAMHLGPTVLLQVFQGKPLLMTLFTVSITFSYILYMLCKLSCSYIFLYYLILLYRC